ncbi:hypothetical protein JWG45_13235 [Leptospira sp. 201903070]|uniref:Uncharacterized protein n=1 Tax=Leptospira ainlahdjerensis TaxID=2810033 RepID=A0ABS2UCL4_9LEPT|nr:hypothetical protein [Leptospira ainlahdjerensis]MBM9578114.1 hypothetical protein [Leptospira ainlahdjerensis]
MKQDNGKFLNFIFLSTLFLQSACASTHDRDLPNSWFLSIVTFFILSISGVVFLIIKKWHLISALLGLFVFSIGYLVSAVMLITYDDTCNDRKNFGDCWSISSLTLKEGIVTGVSSISAVLFYVSCLFVLMALKKILFRHFDFDKKEK